MDIKLLCLAGGLSSRFGGSPKAFTRVGPNDEYLIELIFNQALQSNFSEIICVVNEQVKPIFESEIGTSYHGVPVKYALQSSGHTFHNYGRVKPLGTTEAVYCAMTKLVNDKGFCPFVIINSDDLCGTNAYKTLFDHLSTITYEPGYNNDTLISIRPLQCATVSYPLSKMMPVNGEVNRGVFELQDGMVVGFTEQLKVSRDNYIARGLCDDSPCNANLFAIQPYALYDIMGLIQEFDEFLRDCSNGKAQGDVKTVEAIIGVDLMKLISRGLISMKCYQTDEQWRGITSPEDATILKAELKSQ